MYLFNISITYHVLQSELENEKANIIVLHGSYLLNLISQLHFC